MANLKNSKSQSMGLHKEVLTGRTQQVFFNPEEAENFFYYGAYDVDFNKRTEIDAVDLTKVFIRSQSSSVFFFQLSFVLFGFFRIDR